MSRIPFPLLSCARVGLSLVFPSTLSTALLILLVVVAKTSFAVTLPSKTMYLADWSCGWSPETFQFNSALEACNCALASRNAYIPNDPVQGPSTPLSGGSCRGAEGRIHAFWKSKTFVWSAAGPKNVGMPKPEMCVSNPVNAGTGNKFQAEVDYVGSGSFPLYFARYYNGPLDSLGTQGIGYNWQAFSRIQILSSAVLIVTRPGQSVVPFESVSGNWVSDADVSDRLETISGGWRYTRTDGQIETFDASGRLVGITSPAGFVHTLMYSDGTSGPNGGYIINSAGNPTTAILPAGQLIRVTDSFGKSLLFYYNSNLDMTKFVDPAGTVYRYTYDAYHNPTSVIYPDGKVRTYIYNESANTSNTNLPSALTGILDENNARFATYKYDAQARTIWSEHNGGMERFSLSYGSGQTTVTDTANTQEIVSFATSLGVKNLTSKVNQVDAKSLEQTFSPANNLTCRKNEEGRVTTYTYNATNQRVSLTEGQTGTCTAPVTTAATRTTTVSYVSPTRDLPTLISAPSVAAGQTKTTAIAYGDTAHPNLPTSITQSGYTPAGSAVSRTMTLAYTASGQLASINGARTDVGDVTTFTYYTCASGGACGQVQSITNAAGQVTTFDSYDGNGRLLQLTAPNGLRTNYLYDARGRITRITQTPLAGAARITQYSYNAAGNITAVSFPDGRTLTYTYSAAQKLTRVTDNAGNHVDYGYDLKGNRTAEYTYDPANTLVRQIDLAYDARNRLAQINNAGSLTQQVFDAVGNLIQTTDPKGNPPTQNSFDALNRTVQTLNSLGGATTYSYDPNDKLKQITAPNNATTQYHYDDLGNLLQETSPDRGITTYTYDSAGNVTTVTDARGISATYSYDALNRITSLDYPGTGDDITYSYDTCSAGRLCHITDASGTIDYSYDAFGNVTQQQTTELGVTYTTHYTYDAGDRITSITYPEGRTVSYTRDTVGRISAVTATVNGSPQTIANNRTYRPDGLLLAQSYGNGITESRTYNTKGELTYQSIGTADTRLYGYDANGNPTSIQALAQVGAYGYDALDRLIQDSITSTPSSTVNLVYDGNGNRVSDSANTYSYSTASNRLTAINATSVTMDAAGNITHDGTYAYAYHNDGHLQSVSQSGVTLGSYVYNSQRQRTRKTTAAGTTVFHYDINGNLLLETAADGTPRVAYVYANNELLTQINRSGSTDTLTYLHTDQEGTPRLGTDPSQAVVWRWEGRAFGDTPPTGSVTVNRRYGNSYADSESSRWYMGHRYYWPAVGAFATVDPIGLAGGMNPVVYAGDNPLRWVDPSGLDWRDSITRWWNNSLAGFRSESLSDTALRVLQALPADSALLGAAGMVGRLGKAEQCVANRTLAGGGAKLENLTVSEITRIQNAASRTGQEINVVGSRAGGTARATSDWDYVINANASTRNSLSRSLPGAGNVREGIRPNIDIFKGQVDETLPFIRFYPE